MSGAIDLWLICSKTSKSKKMKNFPLFSSFLLLVACGLLSLPQARAVSGSWTGTSGNWSDATNWSTDPIVSGTTAGDIIDLTQTITANQTVTIDSAAVGTVGILNIDSGTNTLATIVAASGSNYLLMSNSGTEAQINLGTSTSLQKGGATLISAPIRMTTGGLVVTMYGVNMKVGAISSGTSGTNVLRVGQGSGNPYLDGVISDGSGKVAVLNDNTDATFITKANSFSGGFTVQRGWVLGGNDAAFGTGTITLGTSLTGANALTLGTTGTNTYANDIVVSNAVAATTSIKILSRFAGSNNTYTGDVDLQRVVTLESQLANNFLTFEGVISGTGSINNSSTGTVRLNGDNTYKGTTTISTGTLLINGDSSGATGAVTISGASTVLGGSGTIGGAVTINSGATLAPGNSPGLLTVANDVTINNNGKFSVEINGAAAGTEYDRLRLTGAGSDFSLTGSNDLVLSLNYTPAANALFFLVDNGGGNAISGIFESLNGVTTDLSQGALFTVDGKGFNISYVGDLAGNTFTGGNDLVIQAVPEPSAWLLLAGGLTLVATLRRRRTA